MAENRVTQEVVEVISSDTSNIRVTQEVVEVISSDTPNINLSKIVLMAIWNPAGTPPPSGSFITSCINTPIIL